MKRLMDWIAGRCGYVPRSALVKVDRTRALWEETADMIATSSQRRYAALLAIIAQDTPNGNATVKRMVKLARDGLGGAA